MDPIARTAPQLGAALRRRRRQLGLTQQQLGEKIHLRQATISKLEAGEPATQLKTILDVASALDLELVVRPRTQSTDDLENVF